MQVDWGAALRPKLGQSVSGDTYVLETFEPHGLQVAVIDGLGGGVHASAASLGAAAVLCAKPGSDPITLFKQVHTAIHGTRGVVMALVTFDLLARHLSFVGVGNIGVQVDSQTPIKPISKNGIVGHRLPTLLRFDYTYNFGDTFVLYSDGVENSFQLDACVERHRPSQQLADLILAKYGKENDDVTVVVIRITE
ncbi:SpoIIE family protein phosphatase [Candidatus Chloroploca sp. M-50]|uniref:SpoIIE family protein phosphatase n=1 Tax=Candidatus Chloroploca mongolica TaxID=2528176 RepID=A0ABS4D994_9CHLR|nr:SpoIIE family protein phosphatase [Candidatus Chloroploca mongolica]MBP1466006.1 SpoIIE family protein phosphatase [Candidatus Chloroploca mongolica]